MVFISLARFLVTWEPVKTWQRNPTPLWLAATLSVTSRNASGAFSALAVAQIFRGQVVVWDDAAILALAQGQ